MRGGTEITRGGRDDLNAERAEDAEIPYKEDSAISASSAFETVSAPSASSARLQAPELCILAPDLAFVTKIFLPSRTARAQPAEMETGRSEPECVDIITCTIVVSSIRSSTLLPARQHSHSSLWHSRAFGGVELCGDRAPVEHPMYESGTMWYA